MAAITVSEALGLIKTLKDRHGDLVRMRDENSNKERRFYGTAGDKTIDKTPVYDVKKLDRTVNTVAMAIRKLDNAIKTHNATTTLVGYDWDDSLLGMIETDATDNQG